MLASWRRLALASQVNTNAGWKNKEQVTTILKNAGASQAEINSEIASWFVKKTFTYYILDGGLVFNDGQQYNFTRK